MEQTEEEEKARRTLRRAREGLCFFPPTLASGSALQPAESDPPHDMTLQRQEEDDDRNDSQSRAGHLQLILVALLHAQVGNRDRELLL